MAGLRRQIVLDNLLLLFVVAILCGRTIEKQGT
jgi:hypothetical protein